MARRPRPTVIPSKISAISTNTVISSAVKNSPMTEAATSAIVMESSIVMRRLRRSAIASLKDGIAADQDSEQSENIDFVDTGGYPHPNEHQNHCHERHAAPFDPGLLMIVLVAIVVIVVIVMAKIRSCHGLRIAQIQVCHDRLLASSPRVRFSTVDYFLVRKVLIQHMEPDIA